jgi:Spy/CpxP family protein refolding chaperone
MAAGAALALFVLAAFAAAQETGRPARRGRERVDRAQALADLKLTPEQVRALDEFRKARADERRAFREEMSKLRTETRQLLRDPQADRAKADELIDRRAKLRADREKEALRARAERDKIFTPEQREKIRALRSNRPGRAGLAGRARMGAPRAYWRGWLRGWRRGLHRGLDRGWRRR